MEQKGRVILLCAQANQQWEEPVNAAKSFEVSKRLVWEAYLRVKANGEQPVDGQTIEGFEENLKQPLPNLEPNVVGHVFSTTGITGGNTQSETEA